MASMSWANIKELLFQERKILAPSPLPDLPQETAFESQHSALLKTMTELQAMEGEALTRIGELTGAAAAREGPTKRDVITPGR